MDVLESGRDERRGPRAGVWIGVLVAAVVAVVGWNQLHQRRPQHRVAAVAAPSPTPPSASMVWLTESYNYTNDDRDGSFVLDLDLHNFNNAPVQVEAGAIDDPRGLAQLAMSLVPARFDEIRPGEGRAVKQLRMEARSFATLRLTGRVDCMSFSPDDTLLPLQVNGEPVMLAFPRADPAHYWPLILREATCPS